MVDKAAVIVGAGIAGLLAARVLQDNGISVIVLDKARGVGGRMATRRIQDGVFDHGAQYFTVRDSRFQQILDECLAAGAAAEWARGFTAADGQLKQAEPRYRGTAGMSSIPKFLSRGLDVRLEQRIMSVSVRDGRWELRSEDNTSFGGDALLLTAPVPQSLALLDAGDYRLADDPRSALEAIAYEPRIALMALLDGPSKIPSPGGMWPASDTIAWMADNQQKGISEASAVTIHANAEFSREHFDAAKTVPKMVGQMLLDAASEWIGVDVYVREFQVHAWRYSAPMQAYPERCLLIDAAPPLCFAGDAFGGPRVEGAALSGLSAGEKLLSALS